MPYITQKRRDALMRGYPEQMQGPGELNWKIVEEINLYRRIKGDSYQTFNDIIGALEGAKLEIYRRLVSKLEDEKCQENGDVF